MLISSDPLTNMTVIGNYCFWLVDFEKSSPLKPHCQIKLNFTRSNYGRSSIIFPYFIPIGQKTLSPWTILVSDWLNLKNFFTCETRRHDELLLCRNDVWEVLYKIAIFRSYRRSNIKLNFFYVKHTPSYRFIPLVRNLLNYFASVSIGHLLEYKTVCSGTVLYFPVWQ